MMSTVSEKLLQVAQNNPKVYHSGQLNVVENAECLKNNKSGSAILIDDVSPVTHEMSVKISPTPQKNLLNRLIAKGWSSDMSLPTEDFINTYCSKKISFKQGNTYTFSIKNVSGFSGTVAWSPGFYLFDNGSLFVSNATSTDYTPNREFFTSGGSNEYYTCRNGSSLWSRQTQITNSGPWSMTITPVKDFEAAFIVTGGYVTYSTIITEAQIETGSTATNYVPYIDPVTDLTSVKVSRYGKNLFNQYAEAQKFGPYIGVDISHIKRQIQGTISVSLKADGTFQQGMAFGFITRPKNGGAASAKWFQNSTDSDFVFKSVDLGVFPYSSDRNFIIGIYPSTEENRNNIISNYNIQIEIGTTATDYEPYITQTEYTPNADGTVNGVTSLYPSTTLTTDTNGVIINCEYYKDIDKTFNELTTSVALSGGNT